MIYNTEPKELKNKQKRKWKVLLFYPPSIGNMITQFGEIFHN